MGRHVDRPRGVGVYRVVGGDDLAGGLLDHLPMVPVDAPVPVPLGPFLGRGLCPDVALAPLERVHLVDQLAAAPGHVGGGPVGWPVLLGYVTVLVGGSED